MSGMDWLLLWLGWALMTASPGPATMAIAGTSMQRGRGAGLTLVAGILTGSAAWGGAAVLGVGGLLAAHPWSFEALRYFGAGYLLFLAFKSLRHALQKAAPPALRARSGDAAQMYLKGFVLHATNPKAVLAWGSIFSLTLPQDATRLAMFEAFLILFSSSVTSMTLYALLFSSRHVVQLYLQKRRWLEFGFAGFFGLASVKLLSLHLTS